MNPRIETLQEKKLVGKRMQMSFTNNHTKALWQGFMPMKGEIMNSRGHELYSLEVYPPLYFNKFNPDTPFGKWAAIEVTGPGIIPEGMEALLLPAGLYAVFLYKGRASEAFRTYRYIFETWMPGSIYETDDRPHFAVMGEKYRHDEPDSEEEIWIPIRPK